MDKNVTSQSTVNIATKLAIDSMILLKNDNNTLPFTNRGIKRASWGTADVLSQVIQMYNDGTREIEASNDVFGDPDPGEGKNLIIAWDFNGTSHS